LGLKSRPARCAVEKDLENHVERLNSVFMIYVVNLWYVYRRFQELITYYIYFYVINEQLFGRDVKAYIFLNNLDTSPATASMF
jgi:hypothetical protein